MASSKMPNRRPQLQLIAPSASSEEAAAIAAAIESFLHDTSPPARTSVEGPAGWARAAMIEGVRREADVDVPHPWINT